VLERAKTVRALDRSATAIGFKKIKVEKTQGKGKDWRNKSSSASFVP
jgi:hypothetical protein